MTNLKRHLGALAAGIAATALIAGAALADPALIYDGGGKFDKSFNEAAYTGAEQYKKETGGAYGDLEISGDAQREQAIRQFAQKGFSPIVVPGFSWATALTTVAAEFPETHFVIIDSVVDLPNVRSVVFKEQEGSTSSAFSPRWPPRPAPSVSFPPSTSSCSSALPAATRKAPSRSIRP